MYSFVVEPQYSWFTFSWIINLTGESVMQMFIQFLGIVSMCISAVGVGWLILSAALMPSGPVLDIRAVYVMFFGLVSLHASHLGDKAFDLRYWNALLYNDFVKFSQRAPVIMIAVWLSSSLMLWQSSKTLNPFIFSWETCLLLTSMLLMVIVGVVCTITVFGTAKDWYTERFFPE
jgi:hypothetical protein